MKKTKTAGVASLVPVCRARAPESQERLETKCNCACARPIAVIVELGVRSSTMQSRLCTEHGTELRGALEAVLPSGERAAVVRFLEKKVADLGRLNGEVAKEYAKGLLRGIASAIAAGEHTKP